MGENRRGGEDMTWVEGGGYLSEVAPDHDLVGIIERLGVVSEGAVVALSALALLPEPASNQSDLVLFSELVFP